MTLIIGCGLRFKCLFEILKSLRKCTRLVLGLVCAKDGSPHSESFSISSTPSRTKFSTYFFNISSCSFITGYGLEHIFFSSSFNLKPTRSVFHVPSVPSKNSSNFWNNLSYSLRCISIKFWQWFFIALFKSAFSCLSYKISLNILVEVWICYDSFISSA